MDGFRLTAMIAAGERETGVHRHEAAQLTLVYAGRLDDDRETLEAGEMLFVPAGTEHATSVHGLRSNILLIDIVAAVRMPEGRVRVPFDVAGELPERIREELFGASQRLAPLVTQLLGMLAGRGDAARPWIGAVLDILRADYAHELTLETLARRTGVSPSWLAHAFRKATGATIGDYLRQVRVNAAARALRETREPIGAIAHACGFADQAHLSRVFRALKGTTPGAWRRGAVGVTQR